MADPRRTLWVDATAGAAGDMMLGALLDAGASLDLVNRRLAGLGVGPLRVAAAETLRHGFRATKAEVVVEEFGSAGGPGASGAGAADSPAGGPPSRGLDEILAVLRAGSLPDSVLDFSVRAFTLLGEAEAHVHGRPPERSHLHEAGALDAIADVVGSAAALESLELLGPDRRAVVSAVALGSGTVESSHGPLPIPGPAVLEILGRVGAPIEAGAGRRGELCTPTGAAILATLAAEWGDLPALRVEAVGIGAGTQDPPERANVLRVVVGREPARRGAAEGRDGPLEEEMLALETTVDDVDPRLWPEVLEAVVRAGAVDAWLTPVVMRKGRPGHVLTALVRPASLEAATRAVFENTTTLGVRFHSLQRRALARDTVTVQLDGCEIRVKRGFLDGVAVTIQPEYGDVAAAAARLRLPVRVVLERASAIARE